MESVPATKHEKQRATKTIQNASGLRFEEGSEAGASSTTSVVAVVVIVAKWSEDKIGGAMVAISSRREPGGDLVVEENDILIARL